MALFIEKQATSENQITLLVLLNDEIAGVLGHHSRPTFKSSTYQDVFLAVRKKFWNQGLATNYVKASSGLKSVVSLRRLHPSVQKRNAAKYPPYSKWDLSQKAYKKEEPI